MRDQEVRSLDDLALHTPDVQIDKRRSVAEVVERLFARAADALSRAANCNDAGWEKFHLDTAAAYKELARQMEPLIGIQARIDEKVVTIRRRFNLSPPDRVTRKPDRDAKETIDAPKASATSALRSDPRSVQEGADWPDVPAWSGPAALSLATNEALPENHEAAKLAQVLPLEARRRLINPPSVEQVFKLIEGTLESGAARREAALREGRKQAFRAGRADVNAGM